MVDVDRVEVLKGPQGPLLRHGSTGRRLSRDDHCARFGPIAGRSVSVSPASRVTVSARRSRASSTYPCAGSGRLAVGGLRRCRAAGSTTLEVARTSTERSCAAPERRFALSQARGGLFDLIGAGPEHPRARQPICGSRQGRADTRRPDAGATVE
ncbi:TC.FEV.OM [Acanthosepion pharaonis]|uniref:TC.FEV.OM n=1 Tax=Acanthosepion pharaonis TaxID=158019 RepID=A0A812DN51_ACAPH|nr:TC.FEV.OM [Sepia pharaonis]